MRGSAHLSVFKCETAWNAGANGQLMGTDAPFGEKEWNAAHVANECASGIILPIFHGSSVRRCVTHITHRLIA